MQKEPDIRECGKTTSLFQLIEEFWKAKHPHRVAHRICTLMRKMGVHGIIVEEITDVADDGLNDEQNAINTRLGGIATFKNFRITFLDVYPTIAMLDTTFLSDHVLGCVTVINVEYKHKFIRSYVYESVIRELGNKSSQNEWQTLNGHYLQVKRKFPCSLREIAYVLNGSFFTQQNGITSVCSHACLCMILNNSPEMDLMVRSEDINRKLKINHTSHRIFVRIPKLDLDNKSSIAGPGLNDIKQIADEFGFDVYARDFKQFPKTPNFREFVYGFIESGFPALLSFGTDVKTENDSEHNQHIVAVVGHAINSNSWLPMAVKTYANIKFVSSPVRYLSSLAWIDNFLVNDENVGMQLSLPAHSFHNVDFHTESVSSFTPCYGIGIIPKKYGIRVLAHQAERSVSEFMAANYLKIEQASKNYYVKHLLQHFEPHKHTAVFRTSLVSSHDYIQHVKTADNHNNVILNGSAEEIVNALFGHQWFWLVEISEPDLYVGNKSKVIDILFDASSEFTEESSQWDWYRAISIIKTPEMLWVNSKIKGIRTNNFNATPLDTKAHTPYLKIVSQSPELTW